MADSLNTSAADGVLYADTSSVSVDPAKEVAEFTGAVVLDVAFGAYGEEQQERFAVDAYHGPARAVLFIERLVWKAANLNLLWDITYNASDTLNDGVTAATTYTIGQASKPQQVEVLFAFTHTGDGKKMEIEADKAICPAFQHVFGKTDIVMENVEFQLFADGSDNVIAVRKEN